MFIMVSRLWESPSRPAAAAAAAALCPISRLTSTVHLRVSILSLVHTPDPEHVVTPDEDLAQRPGEVVLDVLLGVGELDVHVAVD